MSDDEVTSTEVTKVSPTEMLIRLAEFSYEIIRSTENDYLSYPRTGPKIAKSLRGTSNSLGDELMRVYRDVERKIPSERAINDAIRVIASETSTTDPVQTYLRYARLDKAIYIDLGDSTGNAIEIKKGAWSVIDRPPVYFRRTALTAPFPRPVAGGDIEELFSIINIPTHLQGLIIGFLIAGMDESIPHPILAINGEQGSGKSFASKRLSALIDPSPAPLQSPPKDISAWVELAAGAYGISLDNLSKISEGLSDAFCRAATGDSLVKRQHYSDKDLVVHQFKRLLILNGINLSEMRDDLADRVIPINLPVISPEQRRYESDLEKQWEEMYPYILGGLFDLCAKVLEQLPNVKLSSLPRMADFARILQAVDEIRGTDSLAQYLAEISKSASNSVDNDSFLKALGIHLTSTWTGTASELLDEMNEKMPFIPDKSWPQNSRQVTDKLARSAPTLRKVGWTIEDLGSNNHAKSRRWMITPAAGVAGDVFTLKTKRIEEEGRSEAC